MGWYLLDLYDKTINYYIVTPQKPSLANIDLKYGSFAGFLQELQLDFACFQVIVCSEKLMGLRWHACLPDLIKNVRDCALQSPFLLGNQAE